MEGLKNDKIGRPNQREAGSVGPGDTVQGGKRRQKGGGPRRKGKPGERDQRYWTARPGPERFGTGRGQENRRGDLVIDVKEEKKGGRRREDEKEEEAEV